jgi:phage repressor protein C with HTH and peptisase S24 domain
MCRIPAETSETPMASDRTEAWVPDPDSRSGDRQAFVARLHYVLDHWPSADRLARSAGISPSAFRKWLRGEAEPSRERLIAVADTAGVPIAWLVRGEGAQPSLHRPPSRATGEEAGTAELDLLRGYVALPRGPAAAAAGAGSPADGHIVEFLAFRHDWLRTNFGLQPQDVLLITAVGDSMEPGIREGDLLLVDTRQIAFTEFGIYVFEARDERLVKRVQRKFDGTLFIISDNTIYQPEIISAKLAEEIKVIGKVVWRAGRL